MLTARQLLRRARALFQTSALDADMDEEMGFHLEMEMQDGLRGGLSADAARRRARVAFGSMERFREEGRDARGVQVLRDFAADVRYAARVLRRAPVFTAVAVLTLALGIGANTAIFSIVNAVILRPLPFPDEERLLSVWTGGRSRAEFAFVRQGTRTLDQVTAYRSGVGVSVSGDGEPARIVSAIVGAEFFDVLGVVPALGRFFLDAEERTGHEPVVVLSHALWRERFASDPKIIGKTIEVDGAIHTVVGVAREDFAFPTRDTRLWVPVQMDPGDVGPYWGITGFELMGRLRPGVSVAQVREDLVRVAGDVRLGNPVWRPDSTYVQGILVSTLHTRIVQDSRLLLFILLSAVGLVLLLSCASVANLLMLRASSRRRELAIRATLGAGERRLARQLFAESMVLALCGAAVGALLSAVVTGGVTRLLPSGTPRLDEVAIDAPALLFTMALAVLTGLVFGVLPARRAGSGGDLAPLAGTRDGSATGQRRLADVLVAVQLAIAVVLTVGAGLLGRSVMRLSSVDPGFSASALATAEISPPRAHYPNAAAQRNLATELVRRVQSTPGITAAALTTQLPFDQSSHGMPIWIDGWTVDPNRLDLFEMRHVTPDFFRTMGISIVQGRAFDERDRADGRPVAIVSETAARRFWPGRNAVGGQVRFPWPGWLSVVGVARDVRNNDLRSEAPPAMYVPLEQLPQFPVRAIAQAADPAAARVAIRRAVAAVAPGTPVSSEQTMERLVERSVAAPKSASVMLLSFGALALLLGAIGTYGLVAYRVEGRRREIAVRIALGAEQASLYGMVLRDGLRLALAGISIGLVASFALARLVRGLLFGIYVTDPVSFAFAPALLGVTAVVACLVPAWRATRVDPNSVLRRE